VRDVPLPAPHRHALQATLSQIAMARSAHATACDRANEVVKRYRLGEDCFNAIIRLILPRGEVRHG